MEWSDVRRMVVPAVYLMLRRWPVVTATLAGIIALLVTAAYLVENLIENTAWGDYLLWYAVYAGIFAGYGLIIAATVSIARSRAVDLLPLQDPPTIFRGFAIMAATAVILAFLASSLDLDWVGVAETLMLVLLVGTAATAFLKPKGTLPMRA